MNEVYRDVEQYMPQLRRYARSLTRCPTAADDLVQDCVLNALSKSHLFRPGTNLRAWLFTILRNQHVSDIRRKSRTGIAVDPDNAVPALSTRPNQEDGLTLTAVERALGTLPEGQRILIESAALNHQSYDEMAKSYGLALGTIKSRISRGRSQLRKALEGRAEPGDSPLALRHSGVQERMQKAGIRCSSGVRASWANGRSGRRSQAA